MPVPARSPEPAGLDPADTNDLAFPLTVPPDLPRLDLDDPLFIGCINAQQRGVPGELSLDLMLGRQSVELGGYVLDRRNLRRLWRLLGIAAHILSEEPPSPSRPRAESGRGITGWDLSAHRIERLDAGIRPALARNAAEIAVSGLAEGEGRP